MSGLRLWVVFGEVVVVFGGMGLGFGPEGPFQPLGLDVIVLCQD